MNKQKAIILLSLVGLIFIVSVILLFIRTDKDTTSQTELYEDPGSGEIVARNTPLNQGQIDNPNPDQPTYLGFSFLNERGLSVDQIEAVKDALQAYSSDNDNIFKEISLDKDSTRYGSNIGEIPKVLHFNITTNRTEDYFITLTYSDLETVEIHLYKADKETLLFSRS